MLNRTVIIQFGSALIIGVILTIVYSSFAYSALGSTYISFNYRNAIFYFVFVVLSCLIIRLAIKSSTKLTNWLSRNYWLAIIGCLIGVGLSLYALKDSNIVLLHYRMEGMDFEYWHPDYTYQWTGYFISIFSALNIYIPQRG